MLIRYSGGWWLVVVRVLVIGPPLQFEALFPEAGPIWRGCECKGYMTPRKRGVLVLAKEVWEKGKNTKIEATLCEASKTKVTEARRLWME